MENGCIPSVNYVQTLHSFLIHSEIDIGTGGTDRYETGLQCTLLHTGSLVNSLEWLWGSPKLKLYEAYLIEVF